MTTKIRVGVLGLTHDHVWDQLEALAQSEQGEFVAAADPHTELLEKARSYGCGRVFTAHQQLLEEASLDAVYIFSDNRETADLAVLAAERGLHILVEKPMAADLAAAARLHAAVRSARVQLLVNWPFYWWPHLQHAIQMISEGRIGEVFQVNYRAAHAGPREAGCSPYFSDWLYDPHRNGAGALIDYCSYGAALTCQLLGLPSRVSAMSGRLRKDDLLAEDNAVLVMEHARAISTSTASWTQIGHLTSYVPMIYGSDGTMVIQDNGVLLATRENENGSRIEAPELPAHRRTSTAYFLHHVISGEPIAGLCGSDNSLSAQHVLEAALISSRTQRSISLPLPASHLQGAGSRQPCP